MRRRNALGKLMQIDCNASPSSFFTVSFATLLAKEALIGLACRGAVGRSSERRVDLRELAIDVSVGVEAGGGLQMLHRPCRTASRQQRARQGDTVLGALGIALDDLLPRGDGLGVPPGLGLALRLLAKLVQLECTTPLLVRIGANAFEFGKLRFTFVGTPNAHERVSEQYLVCSSVGAIAIARRSTVSASANLPASK